MTLHIRANTPFILYHYAPSTPAAVVFILLFFLATLLHAFLAVRTRTWYFIPFILGGLFETIGYTARLISSTQSPPYTTGPYIAQTLTILLAPALLAATIYMILARLIILVNGEKHSPISVSLLTPLFVTGDVLSFLTQSGGGAILANAKTSSKQKLGQWVVVAGLGIQMLFMGTFVAVMWVWNKRLLRRPTRSSRRLEGSWKSMLGALYVASVLILGRSAYRVVEYLQGQNGWFMMREWALYVFDASATWVVMWILWVRHPAVMFGREERGRRGGGGNFQPDFIKHRLSSGKEVYRL
ncbi:RTA1 domain containing protein [Hyaloscypha variabilis]